MTLVQVIFTIILKVAIILFCKENLICWVSLTEIVMPNMLGLKKKNYFFKSVPCCDWLCYIKKAELPFEN